MEEIKSPNPALEPVKNPAFRKIAVGDSLVFNYILFDFDKSEIRLDAFHYLTEMIDYCHSQTGLEMTVKAHTDSVGTDTYNKTLSEKRAEAVAAYFIQNGVDANRLTKAAYGENQPVSDNGTEEGRQLNRRVEFTFYNRKR